MTREEAIKVVKKLLEVCYFTDTEAEGLHTLIPELAESEDERIRKEIIKFIQDFCNPCDPDCDKWIAYLEKQKEEEGYEAIPVESTLEYKLGFKAGKESEKQKKPENVSASTMIPSCWAEEPSLRKEQKPTEPSDEELVRHPPIAYTYPSDASRDEQLKMALLALLNSDLIKVAGNKFTKQDLIDWVEKRQEQKPVEFPLKDKVFSIMKKLNSLSFMLKLGSNEERLVNEITSEVRDLADYSIDKPVEWSEEDETRLTNTLIMLKEYAIHHYSKDDVNKSVDWLENRVKSLRPVKQEWSEEDERMRNQLIYDVEYHKKEGLISAKKNKATKVLYNGIEECYDEKIAWLKSLPLSCPKSSDNWKPSKEQPTNTDNLCSELVDFLIRNDIQEDKAKFLANRILDLYGSKKYLEGLCDGIKQEQPKVDLEKEIKDTCREYRINDSHEQELGKQDIGNIANYYFELGLRKAAEMYDDIEYNRQRAEEESK